MMYDLIEYKPEKHGKAFFRIFCKILFCFLVIFVILTFFVCKYNEDQTVSVQQVALSDNDTESSGVSTEYNNVDENSGSNENTNSSEGNNSNDDIASNENNNSDNNTSDENNSGENNNLNGNNVSDKNNNSNEDNNSNQNNDSNVVVTTDPAKDTSNTSVDNKSLTLSEEQYNNIVHIYGSSQEKTVYLTFDDGPSENITPLILDLLDKENIKATFFLLGSNVERYPDLVKREYNSGHYIANHGYSHTYSEIYQNNDTIMDDYSKCNQALKKVLGDNFSSNVYRFPGGSSGGKYNDVKLAGKQYLKENNIAYLDWNALTCDAEGTPTHESILQNLKQTVGNKTVVVLLMHDSSSKILTYETLSEVIAYLRDNGYTFKTLYDLL